MQYALDSVQYEKNIARLLQCKVNGGRFRYIIKFYALLGKSFFDIRKDLHTVYGDSCISKSAISKWMNRFKKRRDTTKSDKRKGRPVTVSNKRKVAEILEYILEDRRVTVENVAEHFGISYGTAQDIMSNKLRMRCVSARWVPRLLLPEQRGKGQDVK